MELLRDPVVLPDSQIVGGGGCERGVGWWDEGGGCERGVGRRDEGGGVVRGVCDGGMRGGVRKRRWLWVNASCAWEGQKGAAMHASKVNRAAGCDRS